MTRYRPLLSTFLNAGGVSLVNIVSILCFVEMLNRGVTFGVALVAWVVFWFWHALALYWIGLSYALSTTVVSIGTYIGFHVGSLAVALALSWVAAVGSVPKSFRHYAVAHQGVVGWVKIVVSALVAAGIVVGVVLLSQDENLRVLVSIIGDLPLLTIISLSYLYFNPNTTPTDLREFAHFIQLLYKSTPLYLLLFPVALVWQETCGEEFGGWGWRILTSAVVFLIAGLYNLAVYLWARTYKDYAPVSQPSTYKPVSTGLRF